MLVINKAFSLLANKKTVDIFINRLISSKKCSSLEMSEGSTKLSTKISSALQQKFVNDDISRVQQCWGNFAMGVKVNRYLDNENKVLQSADCFVDGLKATSFHDSNDFTWTKKLEENYKVILQELVNYEKRDNLPKTTSSGMDEWLPPRDSEGSAYGPEWKTLGLQDRSVWDDNRLVEFSQTAKILQESEVPSCEVFFAKQGPRSGIQPHSDKNNFIITCHLALDVPEDECWITVGNTKYYWKNGKVVIFDTSITHSTENSSDKTRYVLLIRFWHPDLTAVEIDAFKFIFEYLDYAAAGDEGVELFEMKHLLMGKDGKKVTAVIETDDVVGASKVSRAMRRHNQKTTTPMDAKLSSSNSKRGFG